MSEHSSDRSAVSVRTVELAVAVLFFVFGAVVAWDSHRIGASWGAEGPQAGYFPFYIGLIICFSSAWIFVRALWAKAKADDSFVSRGQLTLVLKMLVPSIVYVVLIAFIGIYVASTIFIAFFMLWLGKYSWAKTVPIAVGVSVAFFMLFEVWFNVPLPKGPLEVLLGLD
ncbi:MAG: tripartite tricarboxylate transporter TctB family protein [Burkholderiales bacterium]